MPSGSHGGGGGHSGGFSFGGGSRGGHSGGGSSSPMFPRTTRGGHSVVIIGGFGGRRGRYVSSGLFSLIQMMIIFGFFIGFIGIIFLVGASPASVKAQYQHDYDYYQSMIAYADTHPEYIIEDAVITDRFLGDGGGKYYITYEFYTTVGHYKVKGYTYTTYTLEQINTPELQRGHTIKLVLDMPNDAITSQADSIDYNYKYTTLEDDDDFVSNYRSAKTTHGVGIVMTILAVALIGGGIAIFIVKSKKDTGEETTTVSTTTKKSYCKYCGTLLKDGALKCDNCGASLTEDKDVTATTTTISKK